MPAKSIDTFGHAKSITCIGAGRIASSLLPAFSAAGYNIELVVSRTLSSAKRLAESTRAKEFADRYEVISDESELVLLCVPDGVIAKVASELALLSVDWTGMTVAHTSGVLSSHALLPLAKKGAEVLSWHPLQTFPTRTPVSINGVYVGIEGEDKPWSAGRRWAEDIQARPVRIATEGKALYHLAATMACNYLVTLQSASQRLLEKAGVPESMSGSMLEPLVKSTMSNVFDLGPVVSLTGPISRGDIETVAMHNLVLREHFPDLIPVYCQMGMQTVELAVKGGFISQTDADELTRVLSMPPID